MSVSDFTPALQVRDCLVTASTDQTIKVWDVVNNQPKIVLSRSMDLVRPGQSVMVKAAARLTAIASPLFSPGPDLLRPLLPRFAVYRCLGRPFQYAKGGQPGRDWRRYAAAFMNLGTASWSHTLVLSLSQQSAASSENATNRAPPLAKLLCVVVIQQYAANLLLHHAFLLPIGKEARGRG